MEYKRLNLRVPMPLYQRIKEYCDSVGSPVGSGMCLLCDAQINALKAQELTAKAQDIIEQIGLLKDVFESGAIDVSKVDP